MACCCFQTQETNKNRQTLSSISLTVQQPRSPTNSDSDKDKKQTEKYPTQLLSDYILNISEDDTDCIKNDYNSISSNLSSSSWFSSKVITNQSVEALDVSTNDLSFQSGSFFAEQLRNLNISQTESDIVKKSVQEQLDIIKQTKDADSFENLSNTFYCHLHDENADAASIGMIIYGFVATNTKEKLKLICCGHCEEWKASLFKGLSIEKNGTKQIKNYIIHQLLERVGAANYASNVTDKTSAITPKETVIPLSSVDITQFHMNMSRREIVKIMSLSTYPIYKVDDNGYLQSDRGLFIGKQYVLADDLGKGAFSKVYEAVDIKHHKICAVKVIRAMQPFMDVAKTELHILKEITNKQKDNKDDNCNCIQLQQHFEWKSHHCFVFPLYGPSILEVMSKNNFEAFPEEIVRSITQQMCKAMKFIHSLGIVFTDLKPENMIFVNGTLFTVNIDDKRQIFLPYDSRIKLIDFGSAVYDPPKTNRRTFNNHLVQTRHYRAPEVVLGMAWNAAVDVWSVGCVVLELLYGHMVFITHCSIDHLHQIQKMIGAIPHTLVRCAARNKFNILFHSADGSLRMESAKQSQFVAKKLNLYFNLNKLEQIKLFNFVSRCLRWRATERIQSDEFFKHEYFKYIHDILVFQHQPNLIKSTELYRGKNSAISK